MTVQTDLTITVDLYLAAAFEPDAERRAELVRRAWAPDGRLIDPPLEAAGHDGINDMHATLQQQFGGHRFRRTSDIDSHHDQLRYAWELVAPDGTVVVAGIDVGEIAEDGRLRRITGFFGEPPTTLQ
jgi:hypothetical protein